MKTNPITTAGASGRTSSRRKPGSAPAIAPVLKWVGGKRQLLQSLRRLLPKTIGTYAEPFIGGGALLFHLRPSVAFVNDLNPELISLYQALRDDVEGVIRALGRHRNDEAHFYEVRHWDRDPAHFATLSPVERAARIIFLNKTCFNGLFRVNSSGEFNAPFGFYENPNICDADSLRTVGRYFMEADVTLTCADYAEVLERLPAGAFVYLDPPYDPVSETAAFTGYAKEGFGRAEQVRLRECCDRLTERGIRFMLSNSATEFIRGQYEKYDVRLVKANRAVNSVATKRGEVDEVVVRNYR